MPPLFTLLENLEEKMQVKILGEKEVRESIPIEIEISHSQGIPQIHVEGLGQVKGRPYGEKYMARFWAMKEGTYKVIVRDKTNVWKESIVVREQKYLSFGQEFTFFFILLFLFSLGVVWWMVKLKKTER